MEPYLPIPGKPPRKVVIDRQRKLFASLDIEELLLELVSNHQFSSLALIWTRTFEFQLIARLIKFKTMSDITYLMTYLWMFANIWHTFRALTMQTQSLLLLIGFPLSLSTIQSMTAGCQQSGYPMVSSQMAHSSLFQARVFTWKTESGHGALSW